mmetsp:Transcript_17881/g.57144  ORF Transcript_17881/g.57144 Transcript_17881/m.57144 type:complete len:238 (-) Transcript_17881:136-849(-)
MNLRYCLVMNRSCTHGSGESAFFASRAPGARSPWSSISATTSASSSAVACVAKFHDCGSKYQARPYCDVARSSLRSNTSASRATLSRSSARLCSSASSGVRISAGTFRANISRSAKSKMNASSSSSNSSGSGWNDFFAPRDVSKVGASSRFDGKLSQGESTFRTHLSCAWLLFSDSLGPPISSSSSSSSAPTPSSSSSVSSSPSAMGCPISPWPTPDIPQSTSALKFPVSFALTTDV